MVCDLCLLASACSCLLTSTCASPPTAAQVLEAQLGVGSQVFWHEIGLLARCIHPRIVPVLGVAVHVRATCRARHLPARPLWLFGPACGVCPNVHPRQLAESLANYLTQSLAKFHYLQAELIMVAMELMLGGSLRAALTNPNGQDELRWHNR